MSEIPNNRILPLGRVLSSPVNIASLGIVADRIIEKAQYSHAAYVCVANVHMVVMAEGNYSFRKIMDHASIVTSDGMPLVWELKRQGYSQAERVSGPDLMRCVCEKAKNKNIPIYFYGGSDEVARLLKTKLQSVYPDLKIAGVESPPLLPDRPTIDQNLVQRINDSSAKIVFVGLGCPKQEFWMRAHSKELNAVLIGVGAAFDFLAGAKQRAPAWMQRTGLEWLFRLGSEPGRLWKRYLVTNSLFLWYLIRERF